MIKSFKDPDGGVEHGRDVNAPEKDDSQVSQIFMVGAKLVGN